MPCTREAWREVTEAESTVGTIDRARECLARGDRKEYDRLKRSLPMVCFMATFTPNRGSKGDKQEAAWRCQAATRLNGLVMLDVDHVSKLTPDPSRGGGEVESLTPVKVFMRIPDHMFDEKTCPTPIMLVHVTPSGDGLRIVFKADPNRGNLSDNQHYMASVLGVTCDEACKDASRGSFVPKAEDILYLNENIFTFDNKEYDERFGAFYRNGGTVVRGNENTILPGEGATEPSSMPLRRNEEVPLTYHGIAYEKIVECWLAQNGSPAVGDRHQKLLRMAGDLRYICDNHQGTLTRVVQLAPFVRDMVGEGALAEVERIAADVVRRPTYFKLPKRVQAVLRGCGVDSDAEGAAVEPQEDYESAGTAFWRRAEPYLGECFRDACQGVDEANRMGAIFASAAMYCSLLTRCGYKHFDGEIHRMNPQVYIIGDPASGKSFADRLDRNIMAAMRAADQPARDAEERYKKETKARNTSSKAQKGDALTQPEGCIRYIPSRTSNAIFYRRAKNAKEVVNGELLPLHLYTFDSELDSSITAQSGGSWIGKHDLELKAFHNELSGVDYANNDSVNQLIPIYWNSVVTGTPVSMAKKISLRNINDGLCSRIAIFRMTSNAYKMMGREDFARNHDHELKMKEWGFFFERQQGELPIGKLIDRVYELCEMAALEAEASDDRVLDFLRKRAVFYATWFVVPQIVARIRQQPGKTVANCEVTEDDLRLADVIFDAVIYYQDKFFGQMLLESWENAKREFVPRAKKKSKYAEAYNALPETFEADQLTSYLDVPRKNVLTMLRLWELQGIITRDRKGVVKKIIKTL